MSSAGEGGVLRPMRESDLPRVLAWRNHPDVRQWMFTDQEISQQEHSRWFSERGRDSRYNLLIFEVDGEARGFVNIGPLQAGGIASWGFYLAPDSQRGDGGRLGRAAVEFAFGRLGLHKLSSEVLGFNEASRRFHERLGFREEGILVHQFFRDGSYHDVIRYGLLASEWEASRKV